MKNLNIIAKTALVIAFAFVLFGTQNRAIAADVELKDRTPIRLRITQTISSAETKAGQLVSFEVLEDVRVGNTIVVKQGSLVVATIIESRSQKTFGRKGQLSLRFDYVKAVDGSQIPLQTTEGKTLKINQMLGNAEKRQGIVSNLVKTTTIASALLPYSQAATASIAIVSGLLKKGKNVGITQGQLIETYTDGSAIVKIQNQINIPKLLAPTEREESPASRVQHKISIPKSTSRRLNPAPRRAIRRNR